MAIFCKPLDDGQLGSLREALLRGKVSPVVLMRLLHELLLMNAASNDVPAATEASNEAGEQRSGIESQLMKARMPYVNYNHKIISRT